MGALVLSRFWGRMFRSAYKKGFTLVEVILSVVILTVGVISVQKILIGSLSALSVIENWDQAEWLLQGKIWEVERKMREKPKGFQPTRKYEVLLGKNRTYQYDLNIRSVSPDNNLMEAAAEISWENRGIRRSITRVFYLMVPYEAWKTTRV
jgi:prepilin-type N-terminal cleavage/methylation domain-containing protein